MSDTRTKYQKAADAMRITEGMDYETLKEFMHVLERHMADLRIAELGTQDLVLTRQSITAGMIGPGIEKSLAEHFQRLGEKKMMNEAVEEIKRDMEDQSFPNVRVAIDPATGIGSISGSVKNLDVVDVKHMLDAMKETGKGEVSIRMNPRDARSVLDAMKGTAFDPDPAPGAALRRPDSDTAEMLMGKSLGPVGPTAGAQYDPKIIGGFNPFS